MTKNGKCNNLPCEVQLCLVRCYSVWLTVIRMADAIDSIDLDFAFAVANDSFPWMICPPSWNYYGCPCYYPDRHEPVASSWQVSTWIPDRIVLEHIHFLQRRTNNGLFIRWNLSLVQRHRWYILNCNCTLQWRYSIWLIALILFYFFAKLKKKVIVYGHTSDFDHSSFKNFYVLIAIIA